MKLEDLQKKENYFRKKKSRDNFNKCKEFCHYQLILKKKKYMKTPK